MLAIRCICSCAYMWMCRAHSYTECRLFHMEYHLLRGELVLVWANQLQIISFIHVHYVPFDVVWLCFIYLFSCIHLISIPFIRSIRSQTALGTFRFASFFLIWYLIVYCKWFTITSTSTHIHNIPTSYSYSYSYFIFSIQCRNTKPQRREERADGVQRQWQPTSDSIH